METRDKPKSRSRWARVKRRLCYGILICFALLLAAFVCLCLSIRSGVRRSSALAMQEHPGDRVEALMAYVSSQDHTLRERNRAVWALGLIGDKRALPLLEKYRTGRPCDHDTTLCQGEIGKAISKCKGNTAKWSRFWT
ncbi:MAG: HEAT repeat domain-containing protein [Planctomycetota bacterium]